MNQPRKSRTSIWLNTCLAMFCIILPFYCFFNLIGIPFEFPVVVVLSFVFGTWATAVEWAFITVVMNWWYRNEPTYHKWKSKGGRPYWDTVDWPIGPWKTPKYPPIEEETGKPEPKYTYFTPPDNWRFQCPKCGVRLQYNPDICWNCKYGADNDSTAYYEHTGEDPATEDCPDGSCAVNDDELDDSPDVPQDWRPIKP